RPDNDSLGFSVLLWYSLTPTGPAIFSHELGHNLGCEHDRANSSLGRGAFDYSYGYEFVANDGIKYKTLEGQGNGRFILYYSKPLVLYQGVPAGVPEGQPDAADNAKTIKNTAPIVAAYRAGQAGTGLRGEYYEGVDLRTLKLTQIDPVL